ncbi:MAG TPA: aminotransferase class III-fold pyridoxal phosphate-dependent enzyme, partial [Blastocatellia bacterium]
MAKLQETWGRLFGVDPAEIGVDVPFLELGADSLLLLQASQAIQDKLGVKIPFRLLLDELPTIEEISTYIDQRLPEGTTLDVAEKEAEPETPAEEPPVQPQSFRSQLERTVVQSLRESVIASEQNAPAQAVQPRPEAQSQAPLARVYQLDRQDSAEESFPADTRLEDLVSQQLEIMSRQLELLRSGYAGSGQGADSDLKRYAPPATSAAPVIVPNNATRSDDNGDPATVLEHPAEQNKQSQIEPEVFVPYQPIARELSHNLNPRQQQHINNLIERVSNRTKESKRLAQDYRKFHADNRSTAGFRLLWKEMLYPLVIQHGVGSRVWDVDGNEYVDLTTGFGSLLYGHSPSFIVEALQEQLKRGIQIGWQSPLAGKAAELICELTGVERVAFCNSGTEAIMSALRLARTVTGRTKIALF